MAEGDEAMDRLSAGDATMLASDHGAVPMNIGAVLVLDPGETGRTPELDAIRGLMARRVDRIPRLRQRLVRPRGRAHRYWADAEDFRVEDHVSLVVLRRPGEPALLDLAADLLCSRLDPRQPRWAARLVTGWDESGRSGLVIVMHHVMVDGIAGLAALAALADQVAERSTTEESEPGSSAEHREAAAGPPERPAPDRPPGLASGLLELGLTRRPRLAEPTSLNLPTGPRRRIATAECPLGDLMSLAHRRGCTVNDLLVVAVVGAVERELGDRGESPSALVVSVPVSSRGVGDQEVGNRTGVLPVRVPTGLTSSARLEAVGAETQRLRTPGRGRSAAPLGLAFRVLARLRLMGPFIAHQRLVNTFVSNLRGPAEPMQFAGCPVSRLVPIGATPGNVGATFTALSYAGQLLVSVVVDPDQVADAGTLSRLLDDELRNLDRG